MQNVTGTPEAAYVSTFLWEFDGMHYICRNVSDSLKDKLKDVFNKWGIGFHADKRDCKNNCINVIVPARQFKRVEFALDPTKIVNKTGGTNANV